MNTLFWFLLAAFCEIGGCFSFWLWLRQGRPIYWLPIGMVLLAVFALALTRIDTSNAARAYATYGGIYILASLLWLWGVEGVKPDRWDVLGAAVCLVGAGIILWGPRDS